MSLWKQNIPTHLFYLHLKARITVTIGISVPYSFQKHKSLISGKIQCGLY